MARRLAAASVIVLVGTICLAAADLTVSVSPRTDYATFRTFEVRSTLVNSARPEFDNPLVVKKLTATLRAALMSRGLHEANSRPDLVVDYVLTNEELNTAASRPRHPLRLFGVTFVVDIRAAGNPDPIWHGVFRDEDQDGSILVPRLLKGATKLVAKYPK